MLEQAERVFVTVEIVIPLCWLLRTSVRKNGA